MRDRELYLPKAWSEDRDRCAEAGIGAGVEFSTKPELAMRMIACALDIGVPDGWVTGDEVYGQRSWLRMMLEECDISYMMAVPVTQRVIIAIEGTVRQSRADHVVAGTGMEATLDWERRQGPRRTPLRELVRVAGARWAIEETFQTAKGQVGLDRYQVRRYDSWYRHITLAMLAHAFLTVTTAQVNPERGFPPAGELIPLTVPEARRLLAHLIWPHTPQPESVLKWSHWRRGHQARAQQCHYKTRGASP